MSLLLSLDRYLLNLEGRVSADAMHYMPRELALRFMREMTGQDFGHDGAMWREWLAANPAFSGRHRIVPLPRSKEDIAPPPSGGPSG